MRARCLAVLAGLAGCSVDAEFPCTTATQCELAGVAGTCEPQGYCSFPAGDCTSGRRFDESAGSGFANTCVAGPVGCEMWTTHYGSSCQLAPSSGELAIAGVASLDTDRGQLTVAGVPVEVATSVIMVAGAPVRAVSVDGLLIEPGATLSIHGTLAVLIAVWGTAMISGDVNADAAGAPPDPGAGSGSATVTVCAGASGADGVAGMSGTGGGGGGAFGGAGGAGAAGAGTSGGSGGAQAAVPKGIRGGCPGGAGGVAEGEVAGGGTGGGGIAIVARDALTLTATAIVTAGGGGGAGARAGTGGGGGGGGAGGLVALDSPMLALAGTLAANGGGGGGGAATGSGGGIGGTGSASALSASGGGGGCDTGSGGDGGANTSSEGTGGAAPSTCGGGGGGGSVGYVLLFAAAPTLSGTISPPPVVKPE